MTKRKVRKWKMWAAYTDADKDGIHVRHWRENLPLNRFNNPFRVLVTEIPKKRRKNG